MAKKELIQLAKELYNEGCTREEIEEILARIGCGYSVDSAIQAVLC